MYELNILVLMIIIIYLFFILAGVFMTSNWLGYINSAC